MFGIPPETPADLRWNMLGIPVRVSPWFWLVSLILVWQRGIPAGVLLLGIVCVFLSILVHEFGHALTARAFGAENIRVVLYYMGGLAISQGGLKRWQRIVELVMGPGAGFILYGLLYLVYMFALNPLDYSESTWRYVELTLFFMEFICIWWGLINLLPVFPLDGGQITRELLQAVRPLDGITLSIKVSLGASVLGAAAAIFFFARDYESGDGLVGLFPALLFALLGFYSWQMLTRPAAMAGGMGGEGWAEDPRQPWEQDPDWWKK